MRRGQKWTPQKIFWTSMLMGWVETAKLTERLPTVCLHLKALFPRWRLGSSYSGWAEAIAAWTPDLKAAIIDRLRQQAQQLGPPDREGWQIFAVDGTRVECPRTEANEAGLGCAGKERTAPQVALTVLYDLRTGLPHDFRADAGTTSERVQLDDMIGELPVGSLLVADAGFASYDLCSKLLEQGKHFLLRVGSNMTLLQELGWEVEQAGPQTVYLWPNRQRQNGLPPLRLRLIVVPGEHQDVYLLTDLDAEQLSDEDAAVIYHLRWTLEVFYRSFKQTMDGTTLRSRTPINCINELIWRLLSLWLLCLWTIRETTPAGEDPLEISVAKARDAIRRTLKESLGNKRPRRRADRFTARLSRAVHDDCNRRGPKRTRPWPQKKNDRPPKPPNVRQPNRTQLRQVQRLTAQPRAA